jgi:hypothetical protein
VETAELTCGGIRWESGRCAGWGCGWNLRGGSWRRGGIAAGAQPVSEGERALAGPARAGRGTAGVSEAGRGVGSGPRGVGRAGRWPGLLRVSRPGKRRRAGLLGRGKGKRGGMGRPGFLGLGFDLSSPFFFSILFSYF